MDFSDQIQAPLHRSDLAASHLQLAGSECQGLIAGTSSQRCVARSSLKLCHRVRFSLTQAFAVCRGIKRFDIGKQENVIKYIKGRALNLQKSRNQKSRVLKARLRPCRKSWKLSSSAHRTSNCSSGKACSPRMVGHRRRLTPLRGSRALTAALQQNVVRLRSAGHDDARDVFGNEGGP